MLRLSIITALAIGIGADAYAGPPKASREPLPTREVERGLLLPKGWLELDLGYSHKVANGAWTSDGQRRSFESSRWLYTTEYVGVRYGVAPRAELWWRFPFQQAALQHIGADGTVEWTTSDASIGDPRFGYRFELYGQEAPLTSVVLEAEYKGPAASESPGTFIGGPLNVSRFVFTTGTPDAILGVGAKRAFGPLAVTAHVSYARRFSAIVQYLIELENSQFLGRIKPGDLLLADVGVMLQAGPVALSAVPRFTARGVTKVGTTSPGISASRYLKAVPGSDGAALDLRGEVLFNASRKLDLSMFVDVPLMGEDLMFFPIEDLHPTLGNTLGATAEVRF